MGTVPASSDYYDAPAIALSVPVAAPSSPPRVVAAPSTVGSSWASKLKPSAVPVAELAVEPEPVEAEAYLETDDNDAWVCFWGVSCALALNDGCRS